MPEQATILVVDDEKVVRDSCCRVLNKDGYRTETAADGETGLHKIHKVKPDVVLVDLKMPGMSGIELLGRIGKIDPDIISIVITGYATIESAVEAMKRNAYDFLQKPFTPDQLRIVTERALEKRRLILQAERLQREKEVMRDNFIALVSHQLRSPLASAKQYLLVIRDGFAGDVSSGQKQMIEKAGTYIDQLLRLINDWLDMSRIEAVDLTEEFEPVAADAVLSDIVELLKPLAETRNVAVETRFPDNLPRVRGNGEYLKQAFTNLISNGIQYNREGGTVTVSVSEENGRVKVEIADTGIGISQEDRHFIFDEFFRVKSKESRGVTGSGLGLPIAKKIIEAHDGSIKVASELGKGTTFTVFLPKAGR